MVEPSADELEAVRRGVRRQALANLLLALRDDAGRSAGRFAAEPFSREALRLSFHDVITLVRRDKAFAFERRDFTVLLGVPPSWPFTRRAQLVPFILEPNDFAHPNSDGRIICLDLQGVLPERIAGLLHDNLRLRLFRLDHAVDLGATEFVRARLKEVPADPRPLLADAGREPCVERAAETSAWRPPADGAVEVHAGSPARADGLPLVDLEVGVLGATVPELSRLTFVRLAPASDGDGLPTSGLAHRSAESHASSHAVDRARAAYLESAGTRLRSARTAWHDGPGLVVDPATAERERLRDELFEVGRALRALGDETIARRYLVTIDNQEFADHAASGHKDRTPQTRRMR